MQYEVKTPGEYVNTIENDWRKESINVVNEASEIKFREE